MVIHHRYIRLFILLFICSCNPVSENKDVLEFFSIKNYIHEQELLLEKENIHLEKSITRDGKSEQKKFTSVNWKKELHPFEDADINKPAWKKSYKKDSLISGNEKKIFYIATEPKLVVRSVEITLHNDTVAMLNISIHKQNSYYKSTQMLQYIPRKGYSIHGSQKAILADSTAYIVNAKFNLP